MSGKTLMARSRIAAAEHPLASLAAYRTMEEGGNAFDAAAAASFALAVLQPHLSGPGGDFFALLYTAKDGRVRCLNSSGWAPASQSVEALRTSGLAEVPRFGHRSVVVPGCVSGVHEMHKRLGKLEFSKTVQYAVGLAESGFPIGGDLVRALSRNRESLSKGARKRFLPNGRLPAVGATLVQKELATCLREIANGPEQFYGGAIARAITEEMAAGGVHVSERDFLDFRPEWCDPLRAWYGGAEVYEVPPNSMGATTLLILKLIQEMGSRAAKPNSFQRVKRMVEAARAAYSARDEKLGDPRFEPFDLEGFLRTRECKTAMRRRRRRRIEQADTTFFAAADDEGNLTSCIQSIFYHFGSRVYIDKYGFFLNNRGSSFRVRGPNMLEPRKRPLHTLSALLLAREGVPFVAMGCSGGEYRPQQHALLVTNVLDYSMDLERAIDFPRFLWDGKDKVRIEEGYTGLDALHLRKEIIPYPGSTGVAQGVERKSKDCVIGVCDVRGEGFPMGS